jgi:type IV secretion system protein VirB6
VACPEVLTGQRFVAQAIAHIDCQAQSIGAYGYGALADPGSVVSLALGGLLSLFIAIFAIRLMAGEPIGQRDLLADGLRVAIVLTLATSWPAWRTLGYDLVIKGPAEISAPLTQAASLTPQGSTLIARLQAADDGIVLLTVYGTGRNTGGTTRSDRIGDSFRGVAVADQEGLANGRIGFLAGALGALGIVRLGAGLLLALAPLMAGLLLFAGTRDLFFGWLRALGAFALGAIAVPVVLAVELAILEPWLRDALSQREAQVLVPSMPTELVVITLSFALISFGLLAVIARLVFFGGMPALRLPGLIPRANQAEPSFVARPAIVGAAGAAGEPSRAFTVADAVTQSMRREDRRDSQRGVAAQQSAVLTQQGRTPALRQPVPAEPLGSTFRAPDARRTRRTSAASEKRDTRV